MNESNSQNPYTNFTNEELHGLLTQINSLDPSNISLLKEEFLNREMFEESFTIDTFYHAQFDPSKLSLKEIQQLVSERLQTGESIESIKSDLADHGITLAELIKNEGQRIDTVFEKIVSASERGVNEELLNKELKEEYKYSTEDLEQVKANLKKRSIVYKISGVCIVVFAIVFLLLSLYLGRLISIFTSIPVMLAGIALYKKGARLAGK